MIRRAAAALSLVMATACAPAAPTEVARTVAFTGALPPMKTFAGHRAHAPDRSNRAIARDFLDLSFRLESGRTLPVLTRFEGPITVRAAGPLPPGLSTDLDRLLGRLRDEAGLDIDRVAPDAPAAVNIEVVSRAQLQRAVPQAACFVVPRLSSWEEFKRKRRSPEVDWTTLTTRERMAIFIPRDVSPQEVRDCLHEELAQALGPLNDLYRLTDSVFNDDNFHTVLTGFDMLILRMTYAPELHSGMTRAQVAAALPRVLARLNPAGTGLRTAAPSDSPRDWIDAVEGALSPQDSTGRRLDQARRAVTLARKQGWHDNRMAFALFAQGRLSLGSDPELALRSFLEAGAIYESAPDTAIHAAHVAMQLAAFALSSGQAETAIRIVDTHAEAVAEAENAALLSSLLMVKAEALALLRRDAEARVVRQEALGWARYGFGSDAEVRERAGEIAALNPLNRPEART